MSDALEDRGKALENEYFRRQEKELIEKMKAKLEAEESEALELQCPKCDGQLFETEYDGITIDMCSGCSGIWLDAGELAHFVDKEDEQGWFHRFFG